MVWTRFRALTPDILTNLLLIGLGRITGQPMGGSRAVRQLARRLWKVVGQTVLASDLNTLVSRLGEL